MTEIEVKVLEIDRAAIEEKLRSLGAELHFSGDLHALFYDFPDHPITSKGDVLRIRREGSQSVLTYKEYISQEGAKVMEEHELQIESPEKMARILSLLGMKTIKETLKHRDEYLLAGAKVVLDAYKGELTYIPLFLEVEAETQEKVQKVLELLDLDPQDAVTWSTYDLIQHYNR